MQINQLMEKLDEFFKTASPSDAFSILGLYQLFGNDTGLENCKKVIKLPYYT